MPQDEDAEDTVGTKNETESVKEPVTREVVMNSGRCFQIPGPDLQATNESESHDETGDIEKLACVVRQ
jgi:hypothetical protein